MKHKKLIIIAVIMTLALSMSFVNVNADEGWSFLDGVLTISTNGDMTDYKSNQKRPWEEILNKVKKIVINEGVKSVGDWSFAHCKTVEEVVFPKSIISIGERAFYNCTTLKHINLSKGVQTIGNGAFNSCVSARRVDLPRGLLSIGNSAFMNLNSLSGIILPDTLNSIGQWAFFGNTSLKQLYFKGDVPETVKPYFIADIHEDYRVYVNNDYVDEWIDAELFDPEHGYWFYVDELIPVYVNNSMVNFDTSPIIVNERTLVPMRAIFEAMGAVVEWDNEAKTAIAKKDGITVKIIINNDIMFKNDEQIKIDSPAVISNGRTLVPVRAISEAFGAKVYWDTDSRSVDIWF